MNDTPNKCAPNAGRCWVSPRNVGRGMLLPLVLLSAWMWLPVDTGLGQNVLEHLVNTAFRDMAKVKRDAEAGDVKSQCILANSLASTSRSADALHWYSKAAAQGNLDAVYQVGHLLLFGAAGSPLEQRVTPNAPEGVRWIFRAATNRHTDAYYDMYRAYKDGIGVNKDLVQAYAWLRLHVNTAPGIASGRRAELNSLALGVDVATSQAGERLAALYKSGSWPSLKVQAAAQPKQSPATVNLAPSKPASGAVAPPKLDLGLKLNGVAVGKTPLAIINGKSFAAGETTTVSAKPKSVTLKCISIASEGVLSLVEGEVEPRMLRMN